MEEKIARPWGFFQTLVENEIFKVKIISIAPGQAPSYQYHFKREESWVVVSGVGELKLDGGVLSVSKGSCIQVKKEQKHQIRNVGNENLVFVEVQTGEYFGEDDIVRVQDDYGRS